MTANGKFLYNRFHVSQSLPSATQISADNIASVISLDGNVGVTLAFAGNKITATFADFSANAGIIVSRKENASYKHNDVVLVAPAAPTFTSDAALPTYPTGTQRFLNGGGEGASPFSPEPSVKPIELSALTTNGNNAHIGGSWDEGSRPITGSVSGAVTFTAAHVADNGGAKAMLIDGLDYQSGGTELISLTDGANTIKSRTYNVDQSVWIVPVTGSPIKLFYVAED